LLIAYRVNPYGKPPAEYKGLGWGLGDRHHTILPSYQQLSSWAPQLVP
jgi:hypothetical protein